MVGQFQSPRQRGLSFRSTTRRPSASFCSGFNPLVSGDSHSGNWAARHSPRANAVSIPSSAGTLIQAETAAAPRTATSFQSPRQRGLSFRLQMDGRAKRASAFQSPRQRGLSFRRRLVVRAACDCAVSIPSSAGTLIQVEAGGFGVVRELCFNPLVSGDSHSGAVQPSGAGERLGFNPLVSGDSHSGASSRYLRGFWRVSIPSSAGTLIQGPTHHCKPATLRSFNPLVSGDSHSGPAHRPPRVGPRLFQSPRQRGLSFRSVRTLR